MSEDKIPFSKPALPIADQINLLRNRGLVIEDQARAEHYIRFIGYYRLSGYFRYFAEGHAHEKFRDNVTFDQVLKLYIFDRKLRGLISDALERIEIAVKASLSNSASIKYGPFWMCDDKLFDYGKHDTIIEIINKSIIDDAGKYKYLFISHYFNTYSDQHPPSWMIMETASFGAFSKIYKNAKGAIRLPVATDFNIQHDILESWLHSLVFTRNVCAHYGRLWNRTFTIEPKIPKKYQSTWPRDAGKKLYVNCCIINHMMSILADGSLWKYRLRELIRTHPSPDTPLPSMGFPNDWETIEFWDFQN